MVTFNDVDINRDIALVGFSLCNTICLDTQHVCGGMGAEGCF